MIAVIGRPAGARDDPAVSDGFPALHIDDSQIGIVTRRDAAFAGNAVDARRPRAGQIDEAGERKPAGVDVIEHNGTKVCTPVMPEWVFG